MRYKEIAVIGMSGRFAGAPDLKSYRQIMLEKKSMIGEPPAERLALMKQDPDGRYMRCGYLENIDRFDNSFFEVGKREARLMSPEQRICLEMAAEAIMDAGYSLQDFRGANCGVYVADGASEYERFMDKRSSASVIGSKNFMLCGQIGYHFDLRGENLSINSGCSSSLLAVHYACEKITFGEVETALVGGIILEPEVPRAKDNQYDILGIMSDDYTIRSFDEKANGTVSGEGGGFVLLKSLEQAERDGDHIYGVIVSGAVNGDGGRCTSVSMPSVEAQGGVICKAWADAPIGGLTEIEAHGIGAPVGDAVEAQGMIDAVIKYGLQNKDIKISTVKSNIGHLFPLSGIASLIKTLIGYQYCESYPIAGLEALNPLIRFEDAGLKPVREVYHWEPGAERMTGISSFGLNGCNTHIVLRNYISGTVQKKPQALLKISAHTPAAFDKVRQDILRSVQETGGRSADLIYTLNTGRDDLEYRAAVYAESFTELQNALETAAPVQAAETPYPVIFAVKSEDSDNPPIEGFTSVMPALTENEVTGNPDTDRKLMLYNALQAAGIRSRTLLLDKIFSAGVKVQNGETDRAAFEEILAVTEINHDYSAYQKQIAAKSKGKPVIVVDFSKEAAIRSESPDTVRVFHIQKPEELAALLIFCYESGMALNWDSFCKAEGLHRPPAPLCPFERKSFWIERREPAQQAAAPVAAAAPAAAAPAVDLPQKKLFLLCSEKVSDVSLNGYPYSDPDFRAVFSPETADIGTDSRLAMLKYITAAGVQPDILLADRNGKAVYGAGKGRISSRRLAEAAAAPDYTDIDRIISRIESAANGYAVTVFDFCRSDALSRHSWKGAVRIIPVFKEGAFADYLRDPVMTVRTSAPAAPQPAAPVQTAQPVQPAEPAPAPASAGKTPEQTDAEEFLERTWAKAFNLDGGIGHDEDFFALGGNSLIMQSMSDEINEHFHKKFDIFEIYDYETIEKLAAKILEED